MKIYVNADTRLEDARSSASAFTFAGAVGIIVLILLHTGIIPIRLELSNLIMTSIIMGIVSLIFLGMGIHAMLSIRKLSVSASEEQAKEKEILQWFHDNCKDSLLAASCASSDEGGESELYFARYEQMTGLITDRYPELKEEYVDHLVETLYNDIFPES